MKVVIRNNLTTRQLLKKAQIVFNKWIRQRDAGLPCICCGSYNTSEAGHYYSQGHNSSLRFNEINVNLCCTRCNCFLHGNLIAYRQGLLKRYGQQKLDLLDSAARNRVKKWSRTELEIIIKTYS